MNPFARSLLLLSSAVGLLPGCAKNDSAPTVGDTTDCTHSATVIGTTPCDNRGLIIALESPRDTVFAYNLPEEVFTLAPNLPYSGRGDGLFASSAFVRIKLGYTVLAPADRTFFICQATVNLQPFNSMTHGKEVRILCASKVP